MTPVGIPYFSVATSRSVLDVLYLLTPDRDIRFSFRSFNSSFLRSSKVFPLVMALGDPCLKLFFSFFFSFLLARWWGLKEG